MPGDCYNFLKKLRGGVSFGIRPRDFCFKFFFKIFVFWFFLGVKSFHQQQREFSGKAWEKQPLRERWYCQK